MSFWYFSMVSWFLPIMTFSQIICKVRSVPAENDIELKLVVGRVLGLRYRLGVTLNVLL